MKQSELRIVDLRFQGSHFALEMSVSKCAQSEQLTAITVFYLLESYKFLPLDLYSLLSSKTLRYGFFSVQVNILMIIT